MPQLKFEAMNTVHEPYQMLMSRFGTLYHPDLESEVSSGWGRLPSVAASYVFTELNDREKQLDIIFDDVDYIFQQESFSYLFAEGEWYYVLYDGKPRRSHSRPAFRIPFPRKKHRFVPAKREFPDFELLDGGWVYFPGFHHRTKSHRFYYNDAQIVVSPNGGVYKEVQVDFLQYHRPEHSYTLLYSEAETRAGQWYVCQYEYDEETNWLWGLCFGQKKAALNPPNWPQLAFHPKPSEETSLRLDRGQLLDPRVPATSALLKNSIGITRDDTTRPQNFAPFVLGGTVVRDSVYTAGVLVSGIKGSGKSILIRDMLRQGVERWKCDPRVRLLVRDPKPDLSPYLDYLGVADKYRVLCPFDASCHYWDISRDLSDPETLKNLAATFFPLEGSRDEIWPRSARDLFEEIVISFIEAGPPGCDWGLLDVILAASSPKRVYAVLERTASGREFLQVAEGTQAGKNFVQQTKFSLSDLRTVAIALEHARRSGRPRFSISEWANRSDEDFPILLLGHYENAKQEVERYYQGLIELARMKLLSGEEVKNAISWLVIDEASMLAPLKSLAEIADRGRSYGIVPILGLQDPVRFQVEVGEGQKERGNYIEGFGTKLFLRAEGAAAEWQSNQCGKDHRKVWDRTSSHSVSDAAGGGTTLSAGMSSSPQGNSTSSGIAVNNHSSRTEGKTYSETVQSHLVDLIPASAFAALPDPAVKGTIEYVVKSDPSLGFDGIWKDSFPMKSGPSEWPERSWGPRPTSQGAFTRSSEKFWLRDVAWDADRLIELGLPLSLLGSTSTMPEGKQPQTSTVSALYEPDF